MQIVINIPEDSYKATCNGQMLPPDVENVVQGIKNGVSLPKGHGRLVDADEIIEQANNMADELDNDYTIADIEKVGTLLKSISTIIEADAEGEE